MRKLTYNNTEYLFDNHNCYWSVEEYKSAINRIPLTVYNTSTLPVLLGRKWKKCIELLLPVFQYLKHFNKDQPIQLNIYNPHLLKQTTFEFNVNVKYSKRKKVYTQFSIERLDSKKDYERNFLDMSDIYRFLVQLNIIGVLSDKYHYNKNNRSEGYSKCYVFHKENFERFNSLIKNNTNEQVVSDKTDFTDIEEIEELANPILLSEIRKEIGKQPSYSAEYVYSLKKGKCRPYSYFCSKWKSLEKLNYVREDNTIEYREDHLDKYFGKGNWIEWDRNSSIYNVTLSINKKKVNPNTEEGGDNLYELFMGRQFKDKEERRLFKLLMMSIYFGNLAKFTYLISSTIHYSSSDFVAKTQYDRKCCKMAQDNIERVNAALMFAGVEDTDTQEVIIAKARNWFIETRKRMKKVIGNFKKNYEIFIYEGIINLRTQNQLNEMGYKTVSVYDGFYTECKDTKLISSIYAKNVEYLLTKIIQE